MFALGKNIQPQPNFATGFVLIPKASLWLPKTAVDEKALEKKLLICKQIVEFTFILPNLITHITLIRKIALTFGA